MPPWPRPSCGWAGCPRVIRPAIATPIPNLKRDWPTVLLDAGANAECTSAMLVQFAQMGAAFAAKRYGVERPRVALLSIGEEKSKGTPLDEGDPRPAGRRARGTADFDFVGNVEGRDFFDDSADVIVTDGFTGNVALKTLEGTLRFLIGALTDILGRPEVAEAADGPAPAPAARWPPPSTPTAPGGPCCSGVDGVCVISHGSSSSVAMVNAITVAHDLAVGGLVDAVAASVTPVRVADRPRPQPGRADSGPSAAVAPGPSRLGGRLSPRRRKQSRRRPRPAWPRGPGPRARRR